MTHDSGKRKSRSTKILSYREGGLLLEHKLIIDQIEITTNINPSKHQYV